MAEVVCLIDKKPILYRVTGLSGGWQSWPRPTPVDHPWDAFEQGRYDKDNWGVEWILVLARTHGGACSLAKAYLKQVKFMLLERKPLKPTYPTYMLPIKPGMKYRWGRWTTEAAGGPEHRLYVVSGLRGQRHVDLVPKSNPILPIFCEQLTWGLDWILVEAIDRRAAADKAKQYKSTSSEIPKYIAPIR